MHKYKFATIFLCLMLVLLFFVPLTSTQTQAATGYGPGTHPTAPPFIPWWPAPTPTPTPPPPTPTPTPTPRPTPPPSRYRPFLYTQSGIQLGNSSPTAADKAAWVREYNEMGGASAFELEVARLINAIRESYGLNPLEIDQDLMMASRFYSQVRANLRLQLWQNAGPYGGPLGTATAFGTVATASNLSIERWTAEGLVRAWMDNPAQRATILHAYNTHIGVGSQLGERWGIFQYQAFRGVYHTKLLRADDTIISNPNTNTPPTSTFIPDRAHPSVPPLPPPPPPWNAMLSVMPLPTSVQVATFAHVNLISNMF